MNNTINQRNNQSLAILSLVLGIISFLFSFIPCLGFFTIILGVVAIIFGSIAISRNKGHENKGISIAGLTMGTISLIITIIWILFVVGFNSPIKSSIKQIIEWADETQNSYEIKESDYKFINTEDEETLEELEQILDNIEGVTDNINKDIKKNTNKVDEEIKHSLKKAKKDLKDLKTKMKNK